ncbi:hypothetical protein AB0B28_10455 [Glycomyces sp. NPDC046736]|uniref:hypothetical protein n=1 Tax=Glycomyces sp. NPDC046736 TaxID=3155615 RepID=UPI003401ECC3
MAKQKEVQNNEAVPAAESDALRLSDISGRDSVGTPDVDPDADFEFELPDPTSHGRVRLLLIAVAVAGVAVGAVVGGKMLYERRRSDRLYRRAVANLEHARDALVSVASELPERGRDAIEHFRR